MHVLKFLFVFNFHPDAVQEAGVSFLHFRPLLFKVFLLVLQERMLLRVPLIASAKGITCILVFTGSLENKLRSFNQSVCLLEKYLINVSSSKEKAN